MLYGEFGADRLEGGSGADHFVYQKLSDSTFSGEQDIITDFSQLELDKIDLIAIDANILIGGDQAFSDAQLSFDAGTGFFTAGVIGGDALQIELTGAVGFDPVLSVLA